MDFVSDHSYDSVIEELLAYKSETNTSWPLLITPNVDQVVKMHRQENAELAFRLKKSRWILPDGQPLVWLSQHIYGINGLKSRLTGSDFFPQIWSAVKLNQRSAFFILPEASLGEKFEKEYPQIQFFSPPYFSLTDALQRDAIFARSFDLMLTNKPDFLFIGLGFPKQESLAINLLEKLSELGLKLPVTMLLGASFEFYFGTKKRAPLIFQKLGLEFFHRLLSEPGRMFKRYLVDDLAFFPLALKERRKHNRAGKL